MHSPDVSEAKIDIDAPHCPQQPRPVRPCMSVSDGCCMCRWWDLGSSGKPSSQIHTADETATCDATNSACGIGRGTGRACLSGAVMSLVLEDRMVVIEADQTGTAPPSCCGVHRRRLSSQVRQTKAPQVSGCVSELHPARHLRFGGHPRTRSDFDRTATGNARRREQPPSWVFAARQAAFDTADRQGNSNPAGESRRETRSRCQRSMFYYSFYFKVFHFH